MENPLLWYSQLSHNSQLSQPSHNPIMNYEL